MPDTSFEDSSSAPRRASPRFVVEARSAVALVKPYLARLNGWQLEAAHLRAKALARQSSNAERISARSRLSELRAEAETTYAELLAKLPDGIAHSRIEDTCKALKRFADMVGEEASEVSAPRL